jgi:hypothetical protein
VRAPSKLTLAGLRPGQLVSQLACRTDCTYLIELRLSPKTGRRLGVSKSTKRDAVIATNGKKAETLDGGGSVRVRLAPRATIVSRMNYWMKRLKLESVKATVRTVVEPVGGKRQTITRSVTLRLR